MRTVPFTTSVLTISLSLLLAPGPVAGQDDAPSIAGFATGRGKEAAKIAVDVQRTLRELIPTTGAFEMVDLHSLVHPVSNNPKQEAIAEAMNLVDQGKSAYEQLDLEVAQKYFSTALKKFEFGYAYLEKQAPMLECLMYLGATWVLVGEPEKATKAFIRAQDLPGRKVLDPNLFPPNIQEVFTAAANASESGPQGNVTLITVPLSAEIHVNGAYRGGSPLNIEGLRAGMHMVKSVKDGYQPWGGKIKSVAGKKRNLKIKMKKAAKHRIFAKHFMQMAAESQKDKPGEAAMSMSRFLKADRLAIITLSGSKSAITLNGHLCDTEGDFRLTSQQVVLDATGPDFNDQVKEFLRKVLSGDQATDTSVASTDTGTTSAAEDEGAKAAAALLAGSGESGEEGSEGMVGLDLGAEGTTDSASGTDTKTQELAKASGDDVKTAEADEAKKTVEGTKPIGPSDKGDQGMVIYKEWWFWTAIGVVAAGAATGTYFLVSSSGGSSSGDLVLNIH
ncbi:MAG: PEGA domain-containing protein [Deltaproteobacteria bacterium]|nr:PEGA domain-containing protein [Deltaproteobacteria bacterium]